MDLKTIGHVALIVIAAAYAGCLLAIVGIELYRYFKKCNQEAPHDHTDIEEDYCGSSHHHPAGNGLVPAAEGSAQRGPAVAEVDQ